MRKLPSIAATVLALLLVGAGVGSVTALDTGATDALSEQRLTDTQASERVSDGVRADRSRVFETRVAGVAGSDWLDDLDAFLATFDLTETEQEAIVSEADEMRADGAAAADVHHMVHYRLYENGYDAQDVHAYAVAYRLGEAFDLTDEQVDELATGIVAELDAGAKRSEVREYVRETLDEFGVTDDRPTRGERRGTSERAGGDDTDDTGDTESSDGTDQ
jgi:hypothetical protein